MDASMATMSLLVFGMLFLTLGSGIWVGFSLFAGVVLDTMLQFQLQP